MGEATPREPASDCSQVTSLSPSTRAPRDAQKHPPGTSCFPHLQQWWYSACIPLLIRGYPSDSFADGTGAIRLTTRSALTPWELGQKSRLHKRHHSVGRHGQEGWRNTEEEATAESRDPVGKKPQSTRRVHEPKSRRSWSSILCCLSVFQLSPARLLTPPGAGPDARDSAYTAILSIHLLTAVRRGILANISSEIPVSFLRTH